METAVTGVFELLTPVAIIMVGSSALLSLTYFHLYRASSERHLAYWSLAYCAFAVSNGTVYLSLVVPPETGAPVMSFGIVMVSIASLSLLAGTSHFVGRRDYRAFIPIAVLAVLVPLIAQGMGYSAQWVLGIPGLALCAAYAYTGYSLLRYSVERSTGMLLAGVTLIVQALHGLAFPLALGNAFWLAMGTAVAAVLGITIGVGFVLLHFERTRRQNAESRSHALRLETRLRDAEKLEAVGRLAGGVAHDFNNYLTVIFGNAEELSALTDAESRPYVEQMLAASERAAALTDQLLAFSRRQPRRPRDCDLNDIVIDAVKMIERLVGEDIRVTVALAEEPAGVHADRNQIDQVLLNLAANARDAMPNGGELFITTGTTEDTVNLTVTDTGEGMPPDVIAHAFEPFFTTKDAGRGTGLGLASVFGIIKQTGGTISVDSEQDDGTRFVIGLPRLASGIRKTTPSGTSTDRLEQRRARILVVEDDESVRDVLYRALERAGHEVLLAMEATSAEFICRESPHIDLLITDVVMPHQSGLEVAARVRLIVPSLPVLFVSGYPDRIADVEQLEGDNQAFLQKPFRATELLDKLTELLPELAAKTAVGE